MSAAFAAALKRGDAVHIGPHDIWFGDHTRPAVRRDTPDADVSVDAVVPVGRIVVICWRCGTVTGAVVYDANDLVQLLDVAA